MKYKITVKWSRAIRYKQENSQYIPETKGVYEILTERDDKKLDRTYVGKAEGDTGIRERFLAHLRQDEPNPCIRKTISSKVCFFDYAEIPLKDDRADAERELYLKWKYPCNDKEPEGSGRRLEIELEEINP